MTLVLIFDEIAKGTLHMEDEVTTSAYAKSMGGLGLSGGGREADSGDHDQVYCHCLRK